jgi:hypothetical protein
MRIVERTVSAGDREIFDLDEFLSRPLYAHLVSVTVAEGTTFSVRRVPLVPWA